jgi:hypothetical protein
MAELPPAAGEVVAILQNQVRSVLTQRIVLKGDPDTIGENSIVVKVDRSKGPSDLGGPVGMPSEAMIARELDESFAGVDMALSQTFARNSFGPFGYAVGRPAPRVTCLYAWEWGMAKPERLGDAPAGAPSMPAEKTSVRVRLCRSTLGEAEMLALIKQLQVFPPGSRMAYADPGYKGAPGDALAAAGIGYFVAPGVTPPARERLTPARTHRAQHGHRKHRREPVAAREERAAAAESPMRGAVAVPLPGGAAPAAVASPLLAPLAATPRATPDDMPLPGGAAAASARAEASVPLPN